jgi:hypothetical protein
VASLLFLLRNELVDAAMLINRLGLLKCEFLRLVGIDPSRYPTSRPYQVILRFIAGDDSPRISSDLPREIVFNKGTNVSMLEY